MILELKKDWNNILLNTIQAVIELECGTYGVHAQSNTETNQVYVDIDIARAVAPNEAKVGVYYQHITTEKIGSHAEYYYVMTVEIRILNISQIHGIDFEESKEFTLVESSMWELSEHNYWKQVIDTLHSDNTVSRKYTVAHVDVINASSFDANEAVIYTINIRFNV